MDKALEKIQTYLIWTLIILLPIGVTSVFLDPVGLPKLIILAAGISLILLLKAVQTIQTGKLNIHIGTFDLPVLAIIAAYLVATLARTPNKLDAFFSPGIASIVIGSGIFYFLVNQLPSSEKKKLWYVFLASGVVLGIVTIFGFLGVFLKAPQIPDFLKNPQFSVSGDYLTTAVFLGALVPFSLYALIAIESLPEKILVGFSMVIIVLGLSLSIFNILPGKPTTPAIPDINTTWVVAIESIKQNPLWGVGPANYISAFNRFRPLSYNQSPLWPYRFTAGRDFYLTAITETGLVGTAAFGILLFYVAKSLKSSLIEHKTFRLTEKTVPVVSLLVVTITLAVFPGSFLMIIILFLLLALSSDIHRASLNLTAKSVDNTSRDAKVPSIVLGLLVIAGIIYLGIRAQSAIAAEATFKKAFDALNKNDGKATYDLLRSAINTNPLVDRYHASYAQINLALARSLTTQKKDLTDEDKNTVGQLIQQAVREGQATVSLNQERAGNWEVMARIYQSIIPLAKESDKFAIQAYNQTINLDPINPNLRIALGGIYYSQGQWDNAIKTFELATVAKPDFANAHYNLSAAYREKGEIDLAIKEIELVISLVPKDSQDYQAAKTELDNLQKKKPVTPQQGESLTAPQKATTPAISPQLQLPSEATPPAAPIIPGATPVPSR